MDQSRLPVDNRAILADAAAARPVPEYLTARHRRRSGTGRSGRKGPARGMHWWVRCVMRTFSGLVDCHSHYYPTWYLDQLRGRPRPPRIAVRDGREYFQAFEVDSPEPYGQLLTSAFSEPAEKLAFMADQGIDLSLVSIGNPWADIAEGAHSVRLARTLNDDLDLLCRRSDGRLLALGVLPNAAVVDCVTVARELAANPAFVGLAIGPMLGGRMLDDPGLAELWAVLASGGLTVLLHPAYGCSDWAMFGGHGHVLPLAVGFLLESATAALRLILSGTLEQSGLHIVLPHAGGVLPAVLERAVAVSGSAGAVSLDNVYVDSIAAGDGPWFAAVETVTCDRILFGSDHPFLVGGLAALTAAKRRLAVPQTRTAVARAFPRLQPAFRVV